MIRHESGKAMGAKERREREKEQRRQQILDSARKLLFEKGLHGATVNQLAKNAELSVGLIYFYFKSKEEIYAALQEEGLDLLCTMIRDAASGSPGSSKKLKNISRAYYRFAHEYKSYFDILNYFLTAPERIFPENLKSRIDMHGDLILSVIDEVAEEGTKKGELSIENPREFSIMLWSQIHGYLQLNKLQDTVLKGRDFEKLFDTTVDRLIASVSV